MLSWVTVVAAVVGCLGAWALRTRYEPGTTARRVATGVAVLLSVLGLTGVAFAVFVVVAMTSWANNK